MVDQLIGNVNLDVLEGPSCRLGDVSVLGGGWFKEMSGVQFHICNHIEKLRVSPCLIKYHFPIVILLACNTELINCIYT